MKPVFIFLITTAFFLGEVKAQLIKNISTESLSFGIQAGANQSWFSNTDYDEYSNRTGYSVGVFANKEFSDVMNLTSGLNITSKGTLFHNKDFVNMDGNTLKYSYKPLYLEIPVQAKIQLVKGLFVATGPRISYLLSSKRRITEVNGENQEVETFNLNDSYQKFDWGIANTISYELNNGLGFNAGYDIGLREVIDGTDVSHRNLSLGMRLAF